MEPMASRIFSGSDPVSKSGSHRAALWSIFSILDQLKSAYCLQKLIHASPAGYSHHFVILFVQQDETKHIPKQHFVQVQTQPSLGQA